MSLIVLLVEGLTEKILFEKLLPCIQIQDDLLVSQKLTKVLDDNVHRNKIWLNNVQGDNSFVSYIKREKDSFLKINFDSLILVRDYESSNRLPTSLCKKLQCDALLNSIPAEVATKYTSKIFINLTVREIEGWFFIDKEMFKRLDDRLTQDYINERYNNILQNNPEGIRKPCSKLKKILMKELNFKYKKSIDDIYHIVHNININNCFQMMSSDYAQSFNRIVEHFKAVL